MDQEQQQSDRVGNLCLTVDEGGGLCLKRDGQTITVEVRRIRGRRVEVRVLAPVSVSISRIDSPARP